MSYFRQKNFDRKLVGNRFEKFLKIINNSRFRGHIDKINTVGECLRNNLSVGRWTAKKFWKISTLESGNLCLKIFRKIIDYARLRGRMTNINIVGGCSSDDASFDMWITVQSRGSNRTKNEPPGWTAVHHGSLYSNDAVFDA